MPNILIVGGAGYIGSQTNYELLDSGYSTIVIDNLKSGKKAVIPKESKFYQAELLDIASLEEVFSKEKIDGLIHFAANIEVSESQKNPEKYYYNNVVGTLNLLQVMRKFAVDKIVFSSTAAVYGIPERVPIKENDQKNPINTYGRTKWIVEQILQDYHRSYDLQSICLRYFNACGADLQNRTGEMHEPESHLIPIILEAAAGDRESVKIYGDNYDTPDGTCIRDYIHTLDLAKAHVKAMQKLIDGQKLCEAINLGTKNGYSVLEIMQTAKKITGIDFIVEKANRRPGDADRLIADNTKAKEILDWTPQNSELETIISTAWKWYPKGKKIKKEN